VLLGLVGGNWAVAKLATDYLLYRDAVSAGHDWASYLARNVEDLENIAAGLKPSAASMGVFEKAQQVGRVFRYKIFDPEGHLRLVSDELQAVGTDTQNLGEHNPTAARSIAGGNPLVTPKEGAPPSRPPFFSEAYVPVVVNGQTTAIVEAYVDQTRKRSEYRQVFLAAAISLSLLTAFAFGTPAIAWYRRTKEKQRADARIAYLTNHDAMTNLPNRNYFMEKLRRAIDELSDRQGAMAVHHIDLDQFKDINDTLGRNCADNLIKLAADRLRAVAGADDVVARLEGDEFVLLQTTLSTKSDAEGLARRITDTLAEPYIVDGHEISVTASIGIAVVPGDGCEPLRLMKSAGLALYRSKADGRNHISFFTSEMDAELEARIGLEKIIRDAVLNDGFELQYQPAINTADNQLVGFEALVRLRASDGALISPTVFIPVAEEMGLISKIGAWVIRQACLTASLWPADLKVAVNLSPAQFADGDIRDVVAGALAEASLQPQRLELEITEGLLLKDTDAVMMQLRELKELGVAIVMDDFGTGYSSLSYLWRFPFDKIKIDRAFMTALDAADHENAEAVVKTIIGLGRSLHVTVTIEGVENERQVRFVRDAKCDQIQGFYFGGPMSATELASVIIGHYTEANRAQVSGDGEISSGQLKLVG
jgi:diguanylate cyclase (GGDEF)-like protein